MAAFSLALSAVALRGEAAPVARESSAAESAAVSVDTTHAKSSPYVAGFRIQVIATPSPLSSVRTRLQAAESTGLPAGIDWEEGLYKVRIGAFESRSEAEQALDAFSESLPDAWIASTVVKREEIAATRKVLAALAEGE
jgi:hypothetical protein